MLRTAYPYSQALITLLGWGGGSGGGGGGGGGVGGVWLCGYDAG